MKAAVVREAGQVPEYGEFDEPRAGPRETIVSVTASAVNPLTLARASGTHYSAHPVPPFVPGFDGVGRTSDGQRVYFQAPREPYGALAERTPVPTERLVALPDGLNDIAAAAAGIPGMSCWVPLTTRARIASGESVLINGATGAAGHFAIQVAKFLGARKVIVTARDPRHRSELTSLGADLVLELGGPEDRLREAVRREARSAEVGVVLDYLWGSPAATILAALGGPGAPRGPSEVRFVQVGSLAGPLVSLDASLLRSSGVELLGSGIGAIPEPILPGKFREFFNACVTGNFRLATETCPLTDVSRTWGTTGGSHRRVYTVP